MTFTGFIDKMYAYMRTTFVVFSTSVAGRAIIWE